MLEILGWLLLAVGIGGFGLGGYLDLRTTEFPDWLPYSMIILAIALRAVFAFILNDFSLIINSMLVGLGFLGFGLLLYYTRQWGDGDAWMLGVLGFLFPGAAGFSPAVPGTMPFPLTVFFNFFIISLFYLVIYAFVLGLRSPSVFSTFKKNIRKGARSIAFVFFGLLILSASLTVYISSQTSIPMSAFPNLLTIPAISVIMLLFLQYARAVEGDLFKKKISVKKLLVGDVLISDRWRGLTEEEVAKLKKKGGHVWIKEGVRFAPVFIICMLITLFFGSLWAILFPVL